MSPFAWHLGFAAGQRAECPYMDPTSFASIRCFGGEVRLHTYIRSLTTASILGCWTIMGYSRASSQSL